MRVGVFARRGSGGAPRHNAAGHQRGSGLVQRDDRPDIFGQWESEGLDAARRGDVTRLQELLSDGWRPFDAESLDHNGASALDWAAGAGHREVVELLLPLAEGIQCCRRDGRGPAHWAARHGQTEVLRLLVERPAPKSCTSLSGL